MPGNELELPIAFDLTAVFLCAVTGSLVAIRKGYDFVGVFALGLVTGVGGGLIRDSLFLRDAPPVAVTNSAYLAVVVAAGIVVMIFGSALQRYRTFKLVLTLVDALGLGVYAIYGTQKSLHLGLAWLPAVLIGVTNAVGGGLFRDVLTREEPILFKPGQFYAAAAIIGSGTFVALSLGLQAPTETAAAIAIGLTVLLRIGSVSLNWQTVPFGAANHKDKRAEATDLRPDQP